MAEDKKFTADGLVLRGPAHPNSEGSLSNVDLGIFINEKGDLIFKDEYITNILGREAIALRELYTKNKGVFSEINESGIEQLFFKDGTVSRAYSLLEIVNLCQRARQSLTNGPLWWVGRQEINHSECANIPTEEERDKQDAVDILWSVDRFLAEVTNTAACSSPTPLSFYEKTIDPETGEWVWWDVQNLEIVIPPINDQYKLANIISKLSFQQYNAPEPIIFRLYDETAGRELTRVAVTQENPGRMSFPVVLSYFGTLTNTGTGSTENCVTEDCGCKTVECIDGDPACFQPNQDFIVNNFNSNSHVIKVQFHVINYHPNHWERVLGAAFDGEPLTSSSIDVSVFDINPSTKLQRKQSTTAFENTDTMKVTFDSPLADSRYSVSMTANRNVKLWYVNKSANGFTIKASKPFTGFVDWTTIQLNS